MSGKPGRSGRPFRHVVALRNNVINLSWDFLERCLLDKKMPKEKKAEIAKAICVKAIPTEIESNQNIYLQVVDELTNSDPATIRGIIDSLRKSVGSQRSVQSN